MKKRALKIIRSKRKAAMRTFRKQDKIHRKVCVKLGKAGLYYDQAEVWDALFNS